MRLILNKGQRKGVMSSKIVFQLSARAELTPEEADNLKKYKFGDEIVYQKKNMEYAAGNNTTTQIFRNIAADIMDLNISVNNLVKGKTIECKSITEIVGAEAAIMEACEGLRNLLETCRTFDGEQIVEI